MTNKTAKIGTPITEIFDITERSKEWSIDEFLEIVDDAKCYSFEVWVDNGKILYREN